MLASTFKRFFESEKSAGILLILCTIISLSVANSPLSGIYIDFWQTELFGISIEHWINDGLMAIFFLLIGLELEREVHIGQLSNIRNALLPIAAALGGVWEG